MSAQAVPCLIVSPAGSDLEVSCPRCGAAAGEHPAPLALLDPGAAEEPDHPHASVRTRPTHRNVAA